MKPVDKDLIIKGENIYLRPITGEDTEQVLRWRNAPDVVENFLYRKKITVEEHQNWLKNKVFTGAVHQFVICTIKDDTPIGSVYLQNFDEENNKAEWGLFLDADGTRSKGVGTEVAYSIGNVYQAIELMLNGKYEDLILYGALEGDKRE